jgi:hypothetical protein
MAQALDLGGITSQRGAPFFAHFAKGGNGEAFATILPAFGRRGTHEPLVILAHPHPRFSCIFCGFLALNPSLRV